MFTNIVGSRCFPVTRSVPPPGEHHNIDTDCMTTTTTTTSLTSARRTQYCIGYHLPTYYTEWQHAFKGCVEIHTIHYSEWMLEILSILYLNLTNFYFEIIFRTSSNMTEHCKLYSDLVLYRPRFRKLSQQTTSAGPRLPRSRLSSTWTLTTSLTAARTTHQGYGVWSGWYLTIRPTKLSGELPSNDVSILKNMAEKFHDMKQYYRYNI